MVRPPAEEMDSRWQRIQNAALLANLGGMLVYSNQLRTEPLHYLSNYTLLGEKAICYLPIEGAPLLFISEQWDLKRANEESTVQEVRVLGENWVRDIAEILKKSEAPIGIVGRQLLPRFELEALEDAAGTKLVPADKLLDSIAAVKSPFELSLIRQAAKMADTGFHRALEVIREGLEDYVLAAEIDYAMRLIGATDNFQMLAVGRQNTGMLLPFGKKVEKGDTILFEITPANGSVTYSAQLCRTAICGAGPSALMKEKYDLLIEALEESLKVIKPGVKIGEVARIQNEIIGKAGYAEYCRPPYMRARGHGFGLGRIDVEEDSTITLEEGMSLVVHPNQYIPETGYLALGESIIVTASGIERLTRTESKIYECGGKI